MLQIDHQDAHALLGRYGNVMIAVTRSSPTESYTAQSQVMHETMRAEYPNGFAKLIVTPGGTPMPSSEGRDAINRLSREFASSTLALGLVFEGDGLWLSSMRIITRTMMLAVPKSFPQTIFATVDEAARWLALQCGSEAHFSAPDLAAAVTAVR